MSNYSDRTHTSNYEHTGITRHSRTQWFYDLLRALVSYLGVKKDIVRRGYEHRTKAIDGFTTRYGVDKLVWFEIYDNVATAIAREKELKKWRRDWKIRLIEVENPGWVDHPGISTDAGVWIPGLRIQVGCCRLGQ